MARAMWEFCKEGNEVWVRSALCLAVVQGRMEEEINSKDEDGVTGLMWALLNRHNAIVRFLLDQAGLDLSCTSVSGKTALHFAAQVGSWISLARH